MQIKKGVRQGDSQTIHPRNRRCIQKPVMEKEELKISGEKLNNLDDISGRNSIEDYLTFKYLV